MATPILAATRTGLVDLLNPDPKSITLEAIAHGLAHLNRWNGALELPFSVAQHSILVMELFIRLRPDLRRFAIYALLHDAHEYLLGDWAEPSFKAFCQEEAELRYFAAERRIAGDRETELFLHANRLRQSMRSLQLRLDRAIRVSLGLRSAFSSPSDSDPAIERADQFARAIEWATFMPAANGECPYPRPPFAMPRLKSLAALDAADRFAEAVRRELAVIKAEAA